MKTNLLLKTRVILLSLASFLSHPGTTAAQGTAFTYQGRLQAANGAANGSYDFQFALYDLASGGAPLVGPVTNSAVNVNNGAFTVRIDFDPGAFTGATHWLQISVATNGVGSFTPLIPRQELTPTPYAIYSASAGGIPGLMVQPNTNNAPSLIGGSSLNFVPGGVLGATIGGGGAAWFGGSAYSNSVTSDFGTVGGGAGNAVGGGPYATVAGGFGNTADGSYSAVLGGGYNHAHGNYSIVGGGFQNMASGIGSVVVGGGFDGATYQANRNAGNATFIGGGINNTLNAGADYSAIISGRGGVVDANSYNSTIVGGEGNWIGTNTSYSAIGGGSGNSMVIPDGGFANVIGGGENNGFSNTNGVSIYDSVIAGGNANQVQASAATVSGGEGNLAAGDNNTVGGGIGNIASGLSATVAGGGQGNLAIVGLMKSKLGGYGLGNVAAGDYTSIGGGSGNLATTDHATIGGGQENSASGVWSTVGGGGLNEASGDSATVGGGYGNLAVDSATVAGGLGNQALAYGSTVGGGRDNTAVGFMAMVPGGSDNVASGSYDFAAGFQAQATNDHSFVWSDGSATTATTATNQFVARASGGFVLYSGAVGTGVALAPGSGSWSSMSDRQAKDDFAPVNSATVLAAVALLPLTTWSYKTEPDVRHLGPMAQDFYHAFKVGPDDKHITTVDMGGVALAAIQGLNQKLEQRQTEITELRQTVNELKEMVQNLNQKLNGGAR